MSDINELRRKFSVKGVTIESGENRLVRLAIATPEAHAHVYLHGAHVSSFKPGGSDELLFLSQKSHYEPGKPIRGGVPLIFPWFGPNANDANAPMHGFARTQEWDLVEVRKGPDGSITVALELASNDLSRRLWPHDFRLRYVVTVAYRLDLMLEVQNTSASEFVFEQAMHTYLSVGDVRRVGIEGLAGREFLDKTDVGRRKPQLPGPISIVAETDRVYVNTIDAVTVTDPVKSRRLVVDKDGSLATVLWNPWIAKAKAMADFGDNEWPDMLCIETANCAENAVRLRAGESHKMRARIQAGGLDARESFVPMKQWEMTGSQKLK